MTDRNLSSKIYNYLDYKEYLLVQAQIQGRGFKKAISEVCHCQTGYVSHVINGNAHFSLEHIEAISRLLGLSKSETRYFILLTEYTRAGTEELRRIFLDQLTEFKEKHLLIQERVGKRETLTREDQATYYSSWYYTAIHVAVSIPSLQTKQALSKHFQLSLSRVGEILDFLVSVGIVVQNGDRFQVGKTNIHLEKDSPLISKHHTNWRMLAIRSLENSVKGDIHYSSTYSLSVSNKAKIEALIVQQIEQIVGIVKDSKEEEICTLAIDFFKL